MSDGAEAWARACLALDLLATDPKGLRGLVINGRAGPVRDVFLDAVMRRFPDAARAHCKMNDEAFFGGIDVTASLGEGRIVERSGLVGRNAVVILGMAERCPLHLAARLASALDAGEIAALILLDEGAEPDEHAPDVLRTRLAFTLSLDGIGRLEAVAPEPRRGTEATARSSAQCAATLVTLAARLGIPDLRAPSLALKAARAHAVACGRDMVEDADLKAAAELVLAPRATILPEPREDDATKDQSGGDRSDQHPAEGDIPLDDILIEAARAVIPPGLLDVAAAGTAKGGASGAGFGQKARGNRRGRPLPSRPGRPGGQARVDIVATLRAAAPWQGLRDRRGTAPEIRMSDLRLRRFESISDRLIIMAVDASGSAAITRLAEAKGAIELMLAEAYSRRDHVALLGFRGTVAELLLPPTRSLTQTRRRLAALPGGGGTPLASGLAMAREIALSERRKGLWPIIALLTDGRANIALDGTPGRAAAQADAAAVAASIARAGIASVTLDVSRRPNPALTELARSMKGRAIPLPYASAQTMSGALRTAIDDELVS